ncbi:hypothetical protein JCGZ_03209 [Jatropha curcas]|uniref:Uncharacterized protein n=1 Tax=Jatropha curcas TaxID=180498 RepID=A0A067JD59_JATCU|nr:hypothetical protein JCGZ_03209 [Jatropha curcas]
MDGDKDEEDGERNLRKGNEGDEDKDEERKMKCPAQLDSMQRLDSVGCHRPPIGNGKEREWKNNVSTGQMRNRPVGHVWGIGSLVHTYERTGHVRRRLVRDFVMPLTNFHLM